MEKGLGGQISGIIQPKSGVGFAMRMQPHRDGMVRRGSGGGLIGLIKVVVPLLLAG